jgi:hypothetical protein
MTANPSRWSLTVVNFIRLKELKLRMANGLQSNGRGSGDSRDGQGVQAGGTIGLLERAGKCQKY